LTGLPKFLFISEQKFNPEKASIKKSSLGEEKPGCCWGRAYDKGRPI
jgi:hypothetical protein